MLPIFVMMLLLGALLNREDPVVAPFIYTLF
jgi:hypothetical protein